MSWLVALIFLLVMRISKCSNCRGWAYCTAVPTMINAAPVNMPQRRPKRSFTGPVKKMAATEPTLYLIPIVRNQVLIFISQSVAHIMKTIPVDEPEVVMLKVRWYEVMPLRPPGRQLATSTSCYVHM